MYMSGVCSVIILFGTVGRDLRLFYWRDAREREVTSLGSSDVVGRWSWTSMIFFEPLVENVPVNT